MPWRSLDAFSIDGRKENLKIYQGFKISRVPPKNIVSLVKREYRRTGRIDNNIATGQEALGSSLAFSGRYSAENDVAWKRKRLVLEASYKKGNQKGDQGNSSPTIKRP